MKNTTTGNQTATPTTTTEPKAAAKSKTVEVTITIPKRDAKRLERAAKLVGDCPHHTGRLETIGSGRYYETYTFLAVLEGPYWEAFGDEIDSEGLLGGKPDSDLEADDMHERMVEKVTRTLAKTGKYE